MEDKARHLNFNKFVEDRSIEIAKFLVDLELDTKKKGHQALQRSVRRRAMSHNRFRIPRRLRKNMEEDLAKAQSMQKLPKCRKHIRKRRHLITAYKMRSQKVQWLSTHLWAARRMRMANYYGFKVAFTPNNKSFRSAYRHSRHGCTVADLSFYYVVTLFSKERREQLPAFIRLNENSFPICGKIYEGKIIHHETLVCPCYLVRSQSLSNTSFRILFHPAALDEIKRLGVPPGWQASMQQGQTDIYCLNGPQSLSMIEETLKSYGMVQRQESITNKFYAREAPAVYFNLPNNNYSLSNKPLIDSPIPEQKTLVKGYDSQSNFNVRVKMMSLFTSISQQKAKVPELNKNQEAFWLMFDEGQNREVEKTIFKITLRSKYTHRRKNKLSKEQKKLVVRSERQSSSQRERGKGRIKDEGYSAGQSSYQEKQIFVEESIKKQTALLQEVNPVLVASLSPQSFLVMANNADSCRFWRILSKLNVKIIGRKELSHFYLQKGERKFPEDYPETTSFQIYREEQLKKGFEKYLRFPIQKRPNYLKLRSPFPFAGFLPGKPLMIELQVVSRGHCQPFSYICELKSEDLSKISDQLELGHSGIIHCEQGEGQRKKYVNWSELQEDVRKVQPSRKIIGCLTSGGYRYSRSRQGGLGFIDETLLSVEYFNSFGGYLLVRKSNSPHYMLAQVLKKFTSPH